MHGDEDCDHRHQDRGDAHDINRICEEHSVGCLRECAQQGNAEPSPYPFPEHEECSTAQQSAEDFAGNCQFHLSRHVAAQVLLVDSIDVAMPSDRKKAICPSGTKARRQD